MEPATREYLVTFGLGGFVGRFLADGSSRFDRGDRVVLRTARGLEIGEVLRESGPQYGKLVAPHSNGEIQRRVSEADAAKAGELTRLAEGFLANANDTVAVIDAEVLLDGETLVAQVLPDGEADLQAWAEEMSRRVGLRVTWDDLTADTGERTGLALADRGCGKPDCGSGDCGSCSSCGSGCARKDVKSAEDMTGEFARMREEIERGRIGLG